MTYQYEYTRGDTGRIHRDMPEYETHDFSPKLKEGRIKEGRLEIFGDEEFECYDRVYRYDKTTDRLMFIRMIKED